MQASEKLMEKRLHGVRFGCLATGDVALMSASGAHVKHRVLSERGFKEITP